MIEIISISALVLAIILGSIRTDINTGITSITLAFIVGYFMAGYELSLIAAVFPSEMFLTLLSITLLFYLARSNGTLEKMAELALSISKGNTVFIPLIFFFFAFGISAMGAGNIAAVAIIAPIAMPIAYKVGISRVLIAIVICTGANSGTFSPFAPTGIVSAALMKKIGVETVNLPFIVFVSTAVLQSLSAFIAYFVFKGYTNKTKKHLNIKAGVLKLSNKQKYTIAGILLLMLLVMLFKLPVSIGAFAIILLLSILKVGDQKESITSLPWGAILMVTGITTLVGIIDMTGGLKLGTVFLAHVSSPYYVNALLAFVTGVISIFSSSSGVVMPTFISMLPELIENMGGGGDIIKNVIAINAGSHMVDVSPLSILGALCLASAPEADNKAELFRKLLIWGFSMTVAGALFAYIFLDLI